MAPVWLVACLASLLFVFLFLKINKKQKYRFPPGPKGLPIVGSLFQGQISRPHEFYSKLRKEYGDIITVHTMGKNIVVLNSIDAIKEFLLSSEKGSIFSGRPDMMLNKYVDGGKAITSMDYNDTWVKLRKVVHKSLHMYGEGIDNMEAATLQELQHVLHWITEKGDNPMDLADVIVPSSINSISTLVLGKRLEYDDTAHQSIIDFSTEMIKVVSITVSSMIMRFPFLRHIPYGYGRIYQKGMEALQKLVYHMYDKPKESYDPSVTRGLLDMLVKTQENQIKETGDCWLDDDMIKMTIKDLLVAGSITTRGALLSFFLLITYKPEVKERIQKEIDEVIGQRFPSIKDRSKMPYTEATIWELLRYISHAPLAVPHCTTCDVKMREYFIPARTTVVPNLWEVHHDEELWENPWEFRPDRFLDSDGLLLDVTNEKRRNVIPFGVGKRQCAGETFARSRLFLYITILLQRFNFRPVQGEQLPSPDPRTFEAGIVLQPINYRLHATPRTSN